MTKAHIPKELRERVAKAARHRCGYCLTQEINVGTPMDIDHLMPESLGGSTEEENLWLACSLCNDYKGNQVFASDPKTEETVAIFNPRTQRWEEHFA